MSVLIEFRIRRDTAANWAGTNPILNTGEIGYDTTNNIFKVGNNSSTWSQLPAVSTALNTNSVTWDKLQDFATNSRLLGSPSNSVTPQEILLGSGLSMSGNTLSASNLSLGVTVRNETGVTLPKGSAVRISGASGNKPLVSLAQSNSYSTTEVIGILGAPLPNNSEGTAIVYGEITDVNTTGLVAGQPIYLSPTVAGGLTATEPDPPNFQVQIGFCEVVNANNGKIIVAIRHEFTKSEYISDSTQIGRDLLTATDATDAKNILGVEKNTNVVVGLGAGTSLTSGAINNVLIGDGAGDLITGGQGSVAIGFNALGSQITGATGISNTTAGSGGTASATITGITLEKDSGTGDMTVYPTVTLTTNSSGAVTAIAITDQGSGLTVSSGLVFKATTAGIALGAPANWRGTLSSVNLNTAVGREALRDTTTGTQNSAVGWSTLRDNTTGNANSGVGAFALQVNTTGEYNSAMGVAGLRYNTTGNGNTGYGVAALSHNTVGSNNTSIGYNAGRYRSTGTDTLTTTDNSIFIGYQARAADNGETNQVVIAGIDGLGNGSNTTTINNADTTRTHLAGTATSLFSMAGDTMRMANTRNPASTDAGTAGDFCFGTTGGNTYLYYCISSGNWGRVALTTGY